jgi:WD40 repeat protein
LLVPALIQQYKVQLDLYYTTVLQGHTDRIVSSRVSNDSSCLVTTSDDWTIRVWDLYTGELKQIVADHNSVMLSALLSNDNRTLCAGSQQGIIEISTLNLNGSSKVQFPIAQLYAGENTGYILSLVFDSTCKMVLTCSTDNKVRLWDINTAEIIQEFYDPVTTPSAIALSQNAQQIVIGTYEGIVYIEERDSGTHHVLKGHEAKINAVAVSNNTEYILTGSSDTTARLCNTQNGACVRVFTGHTQSITAVALSSDGRYALTGSQDNTVRLWNVGTGELCALLTGHQESITTVTFSPDGRFIVTGSQDNTLAVYQSAYILGTLTFEDILKTLIDQH